MRKTACVGLLLAGLALLGVPAVAAADQAYTATGTLTYAWHGDPARGCAQMGVCGIQGELVVRPDPSGVDFVADGLRRGEFDLNAVTGTVRVHRADPGSEGDCIEPAAWPSAVEPVMFTRWTPGGVVAVTLGTLMSMGRCAGPLPGEIAAVPLRGLRGRGRQPRFDLRETVPFTAGPYSGTLVSTLAFAPDRSAGANAPSGSSGGGSSGPGLPPPSRLAEQVDLTYRVDVGAGALDVAFAGSADPLCAFADACGAQGGVRLSIPPAESVLDVQAGRFVSRRMTRRQVLRDLRAGRLTLVSYGVGATVSQAAVSEQIRPGGGSPCSDSHTAAGAMGVSFGQPVQPPGRMVSVGLYGQTGPFGTGGPSLIRTHCGGPEDSDVFGPNVVLARGSIPAARLLARHTSVMLAAGGGFTAGGFTGIRSGSLTVSLTLVHVSASTVKVSLP